MGSLFLKLKRTPLLSSAENVKSLSMQVIMLDLKPESVYFFCEPLVQKSTHLNSVNI